MKNKKNFDINNEFFIVDSGNLNQVESRLYGFCVIDDFLFKTTDELGNKEPNGNGAYIFIKKHLSKITITQDFIGSYGIYIFRDKDYFAISNSYTYLLDHIKLSHSISLNRDFANYMIASELCSASYSQTMINEIEVLDRSTIINIDITTKCLEFNYIDYEENTVTISSSKGMAILDAWYKKWTKLIHKLHKEDNDIQTDLSGGFDSRVILMLFLGSNIDLNNIFIYSIEDNLHTHAEDFEIAKSISKHYHFTLNNNTMLNEDKLYYSTDDSINISFYLKLGFHKQMYAKLWQYTKSRHCFSGSGGECIRSYWNMNQEEFIQKAIGRCKIFPSNVGKEFEQSTQTILEKSFDDIQKKFKQYNRQLSPSDLTFNLYRETRCRNHFGKDIIENYFNGTVKHAPLLDVDLQKLKLNDDICHDKNLLIAVMFDRYNKDLLSFKFDSNRSIDPKTIAYARELNRKYPYSNSDNNISENQNKISFKNSNLENTVLSDKQEFENTISRIFYSDLTRTLFGQIYEDKVYEYLCKDIRSKNYHPLQSAYSVISISKTIQDVLTSENAKKQSIAEALKHYTTKTKSIFLENDSLLNDSYIENYIALRLDIKNTGQDNNDLDVIQCSDNNIKISKPAWLAKNGNGFTIESLKGELELVLKCINTGDLSIAVRSRDVPNKNKQRIPFWVDVKFASINDDIKLSKIQPVWHDAPFRMAKPVNDNEIVTIKLKWGPHDERQNSIMN